MSKPKFYWIFITYVSKDQMSFIFDVFEFWGFYLDLCTTQFSQVFLACYWPWTWTIHRMSIKSLLYLDACHIHPLEIVLGWVLFMIVFSSNPCIWSSWWWCITYKHVSIHLLGDLWGTISCLYFGGVMFMWGWVGNMNSYKHSSCDEYGYVG